ncbi:MAG: methyltransferase domain-containing protein [Candidatus Latescibacteria bacterium]|nr:methyltransferase domain-containing protein [Candidatus Latescibacterota bacterium]
MKNESNQRTHWEHEYNVLKGIRMEYSDEIPQCVSLFEEIMEKQSNRRSGKNVLDIGCGKGRIGIHLAKSGYTVTGMDYVLSALKEFGEIAGFHGLQSRILLIEHDLFTSWPLANQSIDSVFAITVLNNFISPDQLNHFKNELFRVLKPGGFLIIEFYVKEDGYYGKLLVNSPDKKHGILIDPNNNMTFKIYSHHEVIELLKDQFTFIRERTHRFESLKYGLTSARTTRIIVFRKFY